MSDHDFPASVRYVKNGRGSQWWNAAKTQGQIHAGWDDVPDELLLKRDLVAIEKLIKEKYGDQPGVKQGYNQLHDLLNKPSQHVWVTFEDGFLWWCTVHDQVSITSNPKITTTGHFWLACNRPWSNTSIKGKRLAISDLPGTVTTTAGFRGTICTPQDWQSVLRLIKDETDPDAINSAERRQDYELAVHKIVQRLSPKDFEHLIDLILVRTGWERTATLGGTREGIDVEAENPTAGEVAFVQVKSAAGQDVLDDYVARFQQRRERYSRMIFAVHTPLGNLKAPNDSSVQVWKGEKVAELVVRVGLGKWVESRLA